MARDVLHSASVPPSRRDEKHLGQISAFLQTVPELSQMTALELRRYSAHAQLLQFQPNEFYKIPKETSFVVLQGSLMVDGSLFMENSVFKNTAPLPQECVFLEPTSILIVPQLLISAGSSPRPSKSQTSQRPLPPPPATHGSLIEARRPNSPPDYASLSHMFPPPSSSSSGVVSSSKKGLAGPRLPSGIIPGVSTTELSSPAPSDTMLETSSASSANKMFPEDEDLDEDAEDLDDFSLSSMANESNLESRLYEALAKPAGQRTPTETQAILEAVSSFTVFSQMTNHLRSLLCSKANVVNVAHLGSGLVEYPSDSSADNTSNVVASPCDWMVVLQGTLVVQHSFKHALDHYLRPGDVVSMDSYAAALLGNKNTLPQGAKIRVVSSTDDCALLCVSHADYEQCVKQALVDRRVIRCPQSVRVMAVTETRCDLDHLHMAAASHYRQQESCSQSASVIIMATPEHLLTHLMVAAEHPHVSPEGCETLDTLAQKDHFVEQFLLTHRLFLSSTKRVTEFLWHQMCPQFSPSPQAQRLAVEILMRWMQDSPGDVERLPCLKELFHKARDILKTAATLHLLQKLLRVHALSREVREVVLRRSTTNEPFHMRIYGEQPQQQPAGNGSGESPGVFISHVDKNLCHAALFEGDQVLELNGRMCEGAWTTKLAVVRPLATVPGGASVPSAAMAIALTYNCAIELLNQATYAQLKVAQNWLGYYQLRRLLPRHYRSPASTAPYHRPAEFFLSPDGDTTYGRSAPASPRQSVKQMLSDTKSHESSATDICVSVGRQQSWAGGEGVAVRNQYWGSQQPHQENNQSQLVEDHTLVQQQQQQPGQQTPTLSSLKRMMMMKRRAGTGTGHKRKQSAGMEVEESASGLYDPCSPAATLLMVKCQEFGQPHPSLLLDDSSAMSGDALDSSGVSHYSTMPRNSTGRHQLQQHTFQKKAAMPNIMPSALPTILHSGKKTGSKSITNSTGSLVYSSNGLGRSEPDLTSSGKAMTEEYMNSGKGKRGKQQRRRERKWSGASSNGGQREDDLVPDTALKVYYKDGHGNVSSLFLLVQRFTRAHEVVMLALVELGISYERSTDYVLCECSMDAHMGVKKQHILQPNITDLAQKCKPGHRLYLRCKTATASSIGSTSALVSHQLLDDTECQELRRESQTCLLDVDVTLLARHLCEHMFLMYKDLQPRDLLEDICGVNALLPGATSEEREKELQDASAPSQQALQKLVNFSETMVHWVASEICRPGWLRTGQSRPWTSSAARRAKFLKRFIRIAKLALEWKNLQLFFDIMSGLESGPVSRLKQSWDRVSSKELKLYQTQLRPLLSVSGNMRALRHLHTIPRLSLGQVVPPSTPYCALMATLASCLAEGNLVDLQMVDGSNTKVQLAGIPVLALVTKDLTVLTQVQETWLSEETADPSAASGTSSVPASLRLSSASNFSSSSTDSSVQGDEKALRSKKSLVNFEKLRQMAQRISVFYDFLHGGVEALSIQAWRCEDEASLALLQALHLASVSSTNSTESQTTGNAPHSTTTTTTSATISNSQRRRSLPTMMAALLGQGGSATGGGGGGLSGTASLSSSANLLPSAKKLFEQQWQVQRVRHYVRHLQVERDPYRLKEMSLCCEGGGNVVQSQSSAASSGMSTSQTLTLSPQPQNLSRSNSKDLSTSNNPPSYAGSMGILGRHSTSEVSHSQTAPSTVTTATTASLRRSGAAVFAPDRVNKAGSISSTDSGMASHSTESPTSSMRGDHAVVLSLSATGSPRTSFRRSENSASSLATIQSAPGRDSNNAAVQVVTDILNMDLMSECCASDVRH